MATRTNRRANGGSIRRPKPVTPKAGVTRNGKRRYDCGGRIKK